MRNLSLLWVGVVSLNAEPDALAPKREAVSLPDLLLCPNRGIVRGLFAAPALCLEELLRGVWGVTKAGLALVLYLEEGVMGGLLWAPRRRLRGTVIGGRKGDLRCWGVRGDLRTEERTWSASER